MGDCDCDRGYDHDYDADYDYDADADAEAGTGTGTGLAEVDCELVRRLADRRSAPSGLVFPAVRAARAELVLGAVVEHALARNLAHVRKLAEDRKGRAVIDPDWI